MVISEEQEKSIRSVKRWCRGFPIHGEAELKAYVNRYETGDFQARVELKHELETKFKQACKSEESEVDVHAAIMPLIFAYNDTIGKPVCGQDVNDLIIADARFDGEEHVTTCPRCGQKHPYSVKFDEA